MNVNPYANVAFRGHKSNSACNGCQTLRTNQGSSLKPLAHDTIAFSANGVENNSSEKGKLPWRAKAGATLGKFANYVANFPRTIADKFSNMRSKSSAAATGINGSKENSYTF